MWFCTWCFQAVFVRKFLKTNHSSLSIKTIHQILKNFGHFEMKAIYSAKDYILGLLRTESQSRLFETAVFISTT